MHRPDTPGTVSGRFTDGDPYSASPTAGSVLGAAFLNDLTDNVVRAIELAGLTLEKGNADQLVDAIRELARESSTRGREMIAQVRPGQTTFDLFGLAAPTAAGTITNRVSEAAGPSIQAATINHATTVPEDVGWIWTAGDVQRVWEPDFEGVFEVGQASNCRLWIGLFSAEPAALADPASISCVGFRFDYSIDTIAAGGDGCWKTVSSNGSGSIVKTTGILFQGVQRYRLRIRRDLASGSKFRFYIDNVVVTEHTGTTEFVPATNTPLGPVIRLRHLSDTQGKNVRVGWLRIRSR